MTTKNIQGILVDAGGHAINNATIRFIATSTRSVVNSITTDFLTNNAGAYNIDLLFGVYTIQIKRQEEIQFRTVCANAYIYDSFTETLETLIKAQGHIQEVNETSIQEMLGILAQTNTSATIAINQASLATTKAAAASTAADNASSSAQMASAKAAEAAASAAEIANDAAPKSHVGATGTAHGVATTSVAGFMSSTDKTKLDGIAASANNYTHPASGVTASTYKSVTVDANGHITAGTNPTTLSGYGITDAIPSSLKGVASGVATLDATGKVAAAQLPLGAVQSVDGLTGVIELPLATEAAPGKAAIATTAEVTTGTNDTKFITPAKLAGYAQPKDTTLTALAGVTTAADKLIYATAPDVFTTTSITPFARTLIDDVDAEAMRNTLGIDEALQLKVGKSQLIQYGNLTSTANWADVPAYSDMELGGLDGQLNAQAKALTARSELLLTDVREALRRSYAEAGFNLVDGSFEAGGTLVNANDVLLQESTGKAFSGSAGTVAAGTNPASGGFVDRSNEPSFWSTGRGRLTISTGAPIGIPLENEEWVMIGDVG